MPPGTQFLPEYPEVGRLKVCHRVRLRPTRPPSCGRAVPLSADGRDMVQTMKRSLLAALVLLLAAPAWAQDAKPDFSGKWNLDLAKSDFGPAPPPESIVIVIEHKEPNLKVTSTQTGQQGVVTNERNLTTDGKENTNRMRAMGGEQDVKSTTRWEGTKLATALKMDFQGSVIEFNDSWELSDGGKVLLIARAIKTPQGDFTQKTVFNKQ